MSVSRRRSTSVQRSSVALLSPSPGSTVDARDAEYKTIPGTLDGYRSSGVQGSEATTHSKIRVLLYGPEGCGRRSLIGWFLRYIRTNQDQGFCPPVDASSGLPIVSEPVRVEDETCIYDFELLTYSEQPNVEPKHVLRIRGADVILIILDVGLQPERAKTMLTEMLERVESAKSSECTVVVLANKADLSLPQRRISDDYINDTLDSIVRPYSLYEVSTVDGTLLAEILEEVAVDCLQIRRSQSQIQGSAQFSGQTPGQRECRCFCVRFTF